MALCMALCAVTAHTQAWADCSDPFADPNDILELNLRVSQADWAILLDNPSLGCNEQYPYVPAEFWCGEESPITIGVRHKRGDQRGLDTDQKPPLKLDFNQQLMGQRWPAAMGDFGFRKLTLNNGQEDNPGGVLTALLTEHLSWRLMQAEVPAASGVAYARLNVHFTDDNSSEYHGLYILIEDIDRTAIKRRYGAHQGTLLKTTTGGCRDKVVYDDLIAPNAATNGYDEWRAKDPADYPGAWMAETDKALYLDQLLRAEALRDVLANGRDTVLGRNYSNYFSFDQAQDKRRYLPWDLDDVFRPYPQDVNFDAPMQVLDDLGECSPVGDLTRCAPEIRDRYLEVACQLINGTLSVDNLLAQFDAVDNLVRPIIPEEVALVWPNDDPLDATDETTYAAEYVRIRQWIQDRIPSVRAQIEARGVSCPTTCEANAAEACEYLRCPGTRSCVDGQWTTCIVDPNLELPDNLIDDDCDGLIDEGNNTNPGDPDAGPDDPDAASGGCGCNATTTPTSPILLLLLLLLSRISGGLRWRRQ
jgi:hypothetical protein